MIIPSALIQDNEVPQKQFGDWVRRSRKHGPNYIRNCENYQQNITGIETKTPKIKMSLPC